MDYFECEKLKESKEYKAADELSNAHNDFGFKSEKFAHGVCLQHRTLQQSIMRSIIATIKVMASDEHGHDPRNEGAYKFAKSVVDAGLLDDVYLPCI